MRPIRNALTLVVFASLAAGCSRPAPAPTAPGSLAADRGPKFESELVYTYSVGGGKGRGTDRSVRYDGDKPFVAVTNWKATQAGGGVTLTYDLAFVEHRGGKDVFKTAYTVTTGGATETRRFETEYDGKRTVVVEDKYGSVVLQPPSQASDPKK